jgi:hypothetical protein
MARYTHPSNDKGKGPQNPNVKEAKGKAEATASKEAAPSTSDTKGAKHDESDPGPAAAGATSPTFGIMARHSSEHKAMIKRHMADMEAMGDRHMADKRDMMKRHSNEMASPMGEGVPEAVGKAEATASGGPKLGKTEEKGKGGTEP